MSTATSNEKFAYLLEGFIFNKVNGLTSINRDVIQKIMDDTQEFLYRAFHRVQLPVSENAVNLLAIELIKAIKIKPQGEGREMTLEQLSFTFPDIIREVETRDLRILASLCTDLECG
jgi:hypothetical protein